MKSTIDGAGRVVVPKAIRESLGMTAGTVLDISERDGAVVIEVTPVPKRLVRRGKGLVVEPEEALPVMTAEVVRRTLESGRR